ncbi:MAG: hypothetical protein QOE90_195 [Thermoplasmata archaeon]|jgi:hypothetical protein|nr:hypothetical protein [Thermoplasmata archaeon]
MKRPLIFAFAGAFLLLGALGTSIAMGFHPIDAVTGLFGDACDAPEAGDGSGSAPAASDPCSGDAETQDDAPHA